MKSLDEYRKEIEQDPKARRRLKKLEKEFEAVEDSLTDEELVKYGLKPAPAEKAPGLSSEDVGSAVDNKTPALKEAGASEHSVKQDPAVDSVIDVISRRI